MYTTYHFQASPMGNQKLFVYTDGIVQPAALDSRRLINRVKSHRLPVVRAIFERPSINGIKQYYIIDFTGREFLIRDTLPRVFNTLELLTWIRDFERRTKITQSDFIRMYTLKTARTFCDIITEEERAYFDYIHHFIDYLHPDLFVNFKRYW